MCPSLSSAPVCCHPHDDTPYIIEISCPVPVTPPSCLFLAGLAFLFYSPFHSSHHVSPPLGISHWPQKNVVSQTEHDSLDFL